MLDLYHLPTSTKRNIDYFYGKSDINAEVWEVWEKPRGINMIQITCIGGGAGGGGGATNNSTTARGGGAGGSSGGFTSLLIPAIFLPDVLYVSAGDGGIGGAAGNPAGLGGFGIGSYVSVAPLETIIITTTSATTTATATSVSGDHNLTTGDSVVITGATPGQYNGIYTVTVTGATTFTYTITSTTPAASSPGTGTIYATKINQLATVCYANGGTSALIQASSTATSTAPGAVAAAVIANMRIAGLGNFSALAGQVGGAGGAFGNGAGGAITYPTTGLLLSGGAGGGGGGSTAAASGGTVTAPAQASYVYFSTLTGAARGAPGGNGLSGYDIENPLLSIGASGAGAGNAVGSAGGNGRPGGFGSGGSGGGGGNPGGSGGDGGHGLVCIQSW
jgi:hypothetical protein